VKNAVREFIDGAEAIARGALDAGCDFFAGYPITPASGILMHMLRELPKVGGIGIQGEDEIASLGFCIGTALGGAKPMTATSGPGLALYAENIGVGIMVEVPLVIVVVQRLGPATGAATAGAQGDVQFIRWGTSGGYPIIALAPTDAAECYHLTRRAFDLAQRFRVPVFLATDKEVVMTTETVRADAFATAPADWPAVPRDRDCAVAGAVWCRQRLAPLHRLQPRRARLHHQGPANPGPPEPTPGREDRRSRRRDCPGSSRSGGRRADAAHQLRRLGPLDDRSDPDRARTWTTRVGIDGLLVVAPSPRKRSAQRWPALSAWWWPNSTWASIGARSSGP